METKMKIAITRNQLSDLILREIKSDNLDFDVKNIIQIEISEDNPRLSIRIK